MTDLYPDEEGYISDGTIVGFCKAAAPITLHGAVKLAATAVSSYISVQPATVGTGYGVALKAADTNDYIPVAFKGIVKQIVGAVTFAVGKPVIASGTTAGVVEAQPALNGTTMLEYVNLGNGGTTSLYRLGYALQAGTTAGDEVLVMLAGLS
jgi:hypothetical protein